MQNSYGPCLCRTRPRSDLGPCGQVLGQRVAPCGPVMSAAGTCPFCAGKIRVSRWSTRNARPGVSGGGSGCGSGWQAVGRHADAWAAPASTARLGGVGGSVGNCALGHNRAAGEGLRRGEGARDAAALLLPPFGIQKCRHWRLESGVRRVPCIGRWYGAGFLRVDLAPRIGLPHGHPLLLLLRGDRVLVLKVLGPSVQPREQRRRQ
mmetsp:Transcript_70369/g.124017  ORF Transcript_70369/g.124017 Transcript_70369/m.124017 type:complete len:206 (-) Transcript_70369:393-1010(-)